MEHPCNRCGAAVDNNSPFCPACEAPQIRFEPRQAAQDNVRLHPATVPPAPIVVSTSGTDRYRAAVATAERKRWLRAAIYAGAIGGLFSIIPAGFLLGIPLSGVLAVRLFRNARFQVRIPPRMGFGLGLLAGGFASGIFAAITLLSFTNATVWKEFAREWVERVHRAEVLNPDPQVRQFFEYLLTRHGMAAGVIVSLLLTCVAFVVVAGLAGMASAAISKRRSPQ